MTWTSRLLGLCALLLAAWCVLLAIGLASQLADAADRLHAGAGQPVFWSLVGLLLATVALPAVWLLRLPAALRYPDNGDLQAVQAYQARLRAHLARNPLTSSLPLRTDAEVTQALQHLRTAAQTQTQQVATSVLASTALLQNGKLDALVVLCSQIQLIWRIGRIYGLRPSLRQMGYLYGNVGACMLLAGSLDDVDFAELTAPIVQAATPAAIGSLPGLGSMGSLLTNSLASGAANAFLTLRVGLMADAYCAPQHMPDRSVIRQNATQRAAQLLGSIVKECGSRVTQAVYQRIKHNVVATAQAAADNVKQAGRSVSQATQSAYQATAQGLQQAAAQVRASTQTVSQRLHPKALPPQDTEQSP